MSLKNAFLALFCGFTLSLPAHGEILFEAFYRIEKDQRHHGYMIQRLSSNKQGQRILSSYIRAKQNDREYFVTSKSVARAGAAEPIETSSTSDAAGFPYTIKSKFKKGKGVITYHTNNSRLPNHTEYPQTAPHPSAFLFFLSDFSKFQPDKKYAYSAFFEEAGRTQIGELSQLGSKETGGKRVLHILDDDSGQPIENFVAENGQPLGSRSVSTGNVAYWVATKEEAVGDMTYPTGEMTALFGDLPQGKKNIWIQMPGLKSIKMIESFPVWTSSRPTRSSANHEVQPLPRRGLK